MKGGGGGIMAPLDPPGAMPMCMYNSECTALHSDTDVRVKLYHRFGRFESRQRSDGTVWMVEGVSNV